MAEPDYLAQTAEPEHMTPEGLDAWWRQTFDEAKAAGCTWLRRTIDKSPDPTMALCEAWKERPRDEGPVRWQLTPSRAERGEGHG